MTRINLGISPLELCDKHLLAEYRELPRVLGIAVTRLARNQIPPRSRFTLGSGHVLYFVDKGAHLKARWLSLKDELSFRGFAPTLEWREFPELLQGDVTQEDLDLGRQLLIQRIKERLPKNPKWTNRKPPTWISGVEK